MQSVRWPPPSDLVSNEPPSPRQLIGLGASLAGSVVMGLVIGIALDSWLDRSPLCTVIGLALGVIGAVAIAIVEFRKFL